MRIIEATSVGPRRLRHRVVGWLLLFAFTLQCYATQIHIHRAPPASFGTSIGRTAEGTAHPGKSPGTPDPADCAICQAIAHTGLFFTPATPVPSLPAWVAHVAPPADGHAIWRIAATHDWLSRAPPRI